MSKRKTLFNSLFISLLLVCPATAFAQRPPCYKLLPSKTLAYVRIADLRELGSRFNETSVGRMFQEEELKSLSQHLFEEAEAAFTPASEELGLTLPDLMAIPQGEIALAVTAPPNGMPAPVLMVHIEGQEAAVFQLLDKLEEQIERDGKLRKSNEAIRGTKVTVFGQDEDPNYTGVIHFQRDGMIVMTSNLDVANQVLAAWDGDDEQEVLADNDDFADVMRYSKGPREAVPQIRWFVDPVSFAKVANRGNFGAQAGLAMLPVVGLDGLLALGGSMTFATDEYDSFFQFHMITTEPRTGVLAALAMKRGDATPEAWVPHDAASYTTLNWDFSRTKTEVSLLFDSFRGEDAFQNDVINGISEALGVEFGKVLAAIDDRVSLATWYPKPATLSGVAMVGGVAIADDSDFPETLETILEPRKDNLEQKPWGGYTIWSVPDKTDVGEAEEEEIRLRPKFRPAFALIDDYLLIGNHPDYIERAIIARSNSSRSLEDELDFKLVMSKAKRQRGGRSPGLFAFQRPEEGLQALYSLVTSEQAKQRLADTDNEFLSRLNGQLQDTPLPPFEKLKKHFAPNASVMTADDTGFHYTGFGLRRK